MLSVQKKYCRRTTSDAKTVNYYVDARPVEEAKNTSGTDCNESEIDPTETFSIQTRHRKLPPHSYNRTSSVFLVSDLVREVRSIQVVLVVGRRWGIYHTLEAYSLR